MSQIPPNKLTACAYIPEPHFPPKPPHGMGLLIDKDSKLERFLDKVDANDDGNLSRKELSEAADTDNDGFVSRSEKQEMKAKLQEYMRDDNAIKRLDSDTLGKAKQMLEFLDDDSPLFDPDDFKKIIRDIDINHRLD